MCKALLFVYSTYVCTVFYNHSSTGVPLPLKINNAINISIILRRGMLLNATSGLDWFRLHTLTKFQLTSFIIHLQYFAVFGLAFIPRLIVHSQLALTKFGRCEQSGTMVHYPDIQSQPRFLAAPQEPSCFSMSENKFTVITRRSGSITD